MQSKVRYQVLPDQKYVEASHEESILESALRAKIPLDHSCGGFGTCGTCCVRVRVGIEKLDARNEIEREMQQDRGFSEDERLSCQTKACDGLVIERPSIKVE